MFDNVLRRWIKSLSGKMLGARSRRISRTRKSRLAFEILEDRVTPTNWVVSLATPDSATLSGTLRYAMTQAQNGDTITFADNLSGSTITVSSTLDVGSNVSITGLGAANLAISGGNAVEVFSIASGVTASITGLTIENGNSTGNGGGILNAGALSLSNAAVTDNSASGNGGGVENQGSLTLFSDTISSNTGGDIDNANAATLTAGDANAFTDTTVNDDGTLDLDGNAITLNTLNGDGTLRNSGTAGSLTVNNGGSFTGNLVGGTIGWYTALTVAGATLNLSGNNTYGYGNFGGATTINSGATLQAGSTTAFSSHSNVTDDGVLDLDGYSNSIDALNGNGTVIDSSSAATLTVAGGGSFNGGITGANTALTVGGTAKTFTLTGTNTYTGQTTVNSSDTLLVNGFETSAVSVQGTLGGTGTTGAVSASGGSVNPGSPAISTGTLNASSANFASAGNLTVEITGSSGSVANDLLNLTGALTLGGTSTLTIDLTGLSTSTGAITIVSDGSQTGQFSSVSVVNNPDGFQAGVAYTSDSVTVTLTTTATAPTVTSPTSTSITSSSATLGGNVIGDGGAAITDRGIVYALTANNSSPAINGTGVTQVSVSGTTGVFTTNVVGLTASSAYSYVAYATNFQGTTYSSVGTFTSTASASTPTVSGLSPASGPAAGGTTVVITGSQFTGATSVMFGAANATTFTVNSATQITATAPAGVGLVDVTVATPAGGMSTASAADQFTYLIWDQFNGNAQHTGISTVAAGPTDQILWSTSISLNGNYFEHYGEPVFTLNDTVIVPVVASGTPTFELEGFNGSTGAHLWTITSNYIEPGYDWLPPYQPVYDPITNRVYFAGPGGTLEYLSNPDSSAPTTVQEAFFGESNYTANASAYNGSIYIDTPLTVDNSGNVFFGFEETGSNPSSIGDGGLARVSAAGAGSYITASAAAGGGIGAPALAAAPVLSNDDSMLYEAVNIYGDPYLVEVNATSMTHVNSVYLGNDGYFLDDSTASPMVAPDGTVFMGVFNNNGSRGYMTHFSANLQTQYALGAFGWDDTASIIPTSMVPSYTGTSSYLILTKYNYYAGYDNGNGVNKIAILDPYATMPDPNQGDGPTLVMKEVMTVTSPTEDSGHLSDYPDATREWCTNGTAVDPATDSVFINNEDGYDYRWNLGSDTLTQAVDLTPGYGEPYTPTSIGPNGVVYALNGGTLFALGGYANYTLTNVTSQTPLVVGQPVTFTTTLASTDGGAVPTGSITYSYTSGINTQTNSTPVLLNNGIAVPLVDGVATFATSALLPDHYHLIATYSGDTTDGYAAGSTVLVQAVLETTTTTLAYSSSTFTATVTPTGTSFVPIGTVSFMDGSTLLATVHLNSSDQASFPASSLPSGTTPVTAVYNGDLNFAGSTSNTIQLLPSINTTSLPNGTVGQVYNQTISASGGTGSISFAVTSGSLPTGLSLNAAAGAITGTPTTTTGSPFSFTITATDSASNTASQGYTVAIASPATPISIVSRTVNGDLLNVTSSISSAVESAGSTSVQITTSGADGFYVGELVSISNVGTAAFNGTYTVAGVIDSTDFTYTDANFNASSPGSISNGGSAVNALAGTQRSMVDSITYVFNQAVTLNAGAITMDVNTGYTGTAGALPGTISYAAIDDGHTWIVTFSGSNVIGNSIADGEYDITLNAGDVSADTGSGSLAASQTDTFFRLFGDSNGDASVTSRPDVQNFAAAFGNSSTSAAYLACFDYNADGSITSRPDVQNFAARFGTSLTGLTTTI